MAKTNKAKTSEPKTPPHVNKKIETPPKSSPSRKVSMGAHSKHHCPVCFKMASPRCTAKGHFVVCPVHGNHHNAREGCIKCRSKAQRSEKSERSERSEGCGRGGKAEK